MPNINTITNAYEFWRAMRNKFGEFYSFGSVAGGKGICNIVHVISDPREYLKLLGQEAREIQATETLVGEDWHACYERGIAWKRRGMETYSNILPN